MNVKYLSVGTGKAKVSVIENVESIFFLRNGWVQIMKINGLVRTIQGKNISVISNKKLEV